MVGAMTKGLLYAVAALIGVILLGAIHPPLISLLIFLLCIRWLFKNRHNLAASKDNTEERAP